MEDKGGDILSRFKEHGRIFSSGKVVKLRFPIPENEPMRFFAFKEDLEKLLDGRLQYVRLYLDSEFEVSNIGERPGARV